jgi:hypothetical protein
MVENVFVGVEDAVGGQGGHGTRRKSSRPCSLSSVCYWSGPGPGLVFREGSFSSARISRSAMRRSAIFASSSAIFARMRSSDVSMAALLILNMTLHAVYCGDAAFNTSGHIKASEICRQ